MPPFRKDETKYFWYDFRFAGKRYRGSTGKTTITAARHFEANLITQMQVGEAPEPTARPQTLREFMPRFLEYVDNHQQRALKTKAYYRNGAGLLLKTPLAEFPIPRITTSVVSAIAFPHSSATGNTALRTLSRALSLAVEWGLLRTAPRIHLFREFGRTTLFTAEFEQRLLEVATQPLRDVFILLMNTGMRPQEAYCLRWDDILWDRKVIHISAGKTKAATRYVGLTANAEEMLRTRVRASKSQWVFPSTRRVGVSSEESTQSADDASTTAVKKDTHIHSVAKAFRKARAAAKLPADLVLYSTRHTYATSLTGATGNPHLVASQMGHSSIAHSSRYIHPSTVGVAEIMDKVNEARKEKTASTEDGHSFGHRQQVVQ